MKPINLLFCLLMLHLSLTAQVGIGTTNPDPSSILDIESADKGLLIPRVSLGNITDTQLDGTNTAVEGLLIYNTNSSVTGGAGTGYYYFNGASWQKLKTGKDDKSWYEEGSGDPPDDINDNIYTLGRVAIGETSSNASSILDINSTNKGLLIPRVSLNNTTNTMLDGINTAATGLLIYNTNPSTTYGEGAGFYYFNGTIWEKIGDDLGDHTATKDLDMNTSAVDNALYFSTLPTSNYDKLRVFSSDKYTIGMHDTMSFGFVDGWAMTFSMLTVAGNNRGWVWREYGDDLNEAAMSLTVDGRLSIKNHMRVDTNTFVVDATNDNVGIGTDTPTAKLEVNGKIKAIDVNFSGLPTYPNDNAAGNGGLVAGDMYKTQQGELRIKL